MSFWKACSGEVAGGSRSGLFGSAGLHRGFEFIHDSSGYFLWAVLCQIAPPDISVSGGSAPNKSSILVCDRHCPGVLISGRCIPMVLILLARTGHDQLGAVLRHDNAKWNSFFDELCSNIAIQFVGHR